MKYWLTALMLMCCVPAVAAPLPLPELKSPADLPRRAKAQGPLYVYNEEGVELAAATPVFVVFAENQPAGIVHQNRLLSPEIMPELKDVTLVSAVEYQAIVAALRDPHKISSLDARGLRLFDATLLAWLTHTPFDQNQRWPVPWSDKAETEVRALRQLLAYRRDVVWDLFLDRWLAAQREQYPRPPADALATHLLPKLQGMDLSGLYRTMCNRPYGRTAMIGPMANQHFDLHDAVLRVLPPQPAPACLREQYRSRLLRELPADAGTVALFPYDLYPRLFKPAELPGLLEPLLKRDTPAARNHVAAALATWGELPLAAYRPALQRWAGRGDCAAFDTLRVRSPARELDALAEKLLERGDGCGSALEWLARQAPASDSAHGLLLQRAKTATGFRRQQWVAALAGTTYVRRSRSFLVGLRNDADEVVQGIAWAARRTLALLDLDGAPPEQRAKLRQDYLAEVRTRVDSIKTGSTITGREPLFMLKPGAEMVLRLSPFPPTNDGVRVTGLSRQNIPLTWSPLEVPPELLRLHRYDLPASAAPLKYARQKDQTIGELRLRLDELKIDGQPLAESLCPGIFAVEVGAPLNTDMNSDVPWPTRIGWYCEPDERLWSDAAYRGASSDAQ